MFDDVGDAFLNYYGAAGGLVRRDVVRVNLAAYLPKARCEVLDVGCGEGLDAVWLARRGCRVTAIDPSAKMLNKAAEAATQLSPRVRTRLSFHHIDDRSAVRMLRSREFDIVLCHGVLMYQQKESAFLRRLCRFVRPGGILSLLTRNADALAYRAAAEGDYLQALALLQHPAQSKGRLGVPASAHSIDQLVSVLDHNNMVLEAWFGVKIFSDMMKDPLAKDQMRQLVRLEATASRCDPYRQTGRLVHLIARMKS